MKKLAMIVVLLLVIPFVSATHNRFHTDINGNYLPVYDYAYTTIFNEAYPKEYGFDPTGTYYAARYCGRSFFGQSEFGLMDNGRCTSRYGRYGRYGLAVADTTLLTTAAATEQPMQGMQAMTQQDSFGLVGRGISDYYPDVPAMQTGLRSRNGKASRYYS